MVKCECIGIAWRACETRRFLVPTPIRDSHLGPAWGPEICRLNTSADSSDRGPAAERSDMLMLSPLCAFCVSAAWGPGPQSCQLPPAGLLSGQHVPSTRLPLGKSLPSRPGILASGQKQGGRHWEGSGGKCCLSAGPRYVHLHPGSPSWEPLCQALCSEWADAASLGTTENQGTRK